MMLPAAGGSWFLCLHLLAEGCGLFDTWETMAGEGLSPAIGIPQAPHKGVKEGCGNWMRRRRDGGMRGKIVACPVTGYHGKREVRWERGIGGTV